MQTNEVVDARKTRIDEDAAWALLQNARTVTVAKGKRVEVFTEIAAERETLLQQAMGPSGNLRAPTYRLNDQFVIGFNPELYAERFK